MGKISMHELREMLCKELDELTRKGELSAGSLDTVDKLTHSIKSIDTIVAMQGGSFDDCYDDESSYARGRTGNIRRDSMGRYSRNMGHNYSRKYQDLRGENRGGYSMDGAKEDIIEQLHEILDEAPNEHIRGAIHNLINKISED